MRLSLVVFGLVAVVMAAEARLWSVLLQQRGPPPPVQARDANTRTLAEKYIDMPLDHNDPDNKTTFKMRYLTNDQFHVPGGPIFLMLGGEWTVNNGYLLGGHMFTLGREFNAYLMYTEHRYYGKTRPTPDLTTESLKYLIVDQALEDVADLVRVLKSSDTFNKSKVVVFGGSYAGNMATWMRLKFPELIDGAVASSGPVLAQSDFKEYMETVNDAIESEGGAACLKTVETALSDIADALETENGTNEVSKMFKTCKPINSSAELDVQAFFSFITETFSGLVQYASSSSIKDACRIINDEGYGSPMKRIAVFILDQYGDSGCFSTQYKDIIDTYSSTSYQNSEAVITGRLWIYQTCNEYGYYQTTTSTEQPFGQTVPISYFEDNMCADLYGEEFNAKRLAEGVKRTNLVYGGLKPDVTNVVSVHGSIDPWHRLGILKDLSEDSPSVLVKGTSHCQDLQAPSLGDVPEMTAARAVVRAKVREWVKS